MVRKKLQHNQRRSVSLDFLLLCNRKRPELNYMFLTTYLLINLSGVKKVPVTHLSAGIFCVLLIGWLFIFFSILNYNTKYSRRYKNYRFFWWLKDCASPRFPHFYPLITFSSWFLSRSFYFFLTVKKTFCLLLSELFAVKERLKAIFKRIYKLLREST